MTVRLDGSTKGNDCEQRRKAEFQVLGYLMIKGQEDENGGQRSRAVVTHVIEGNSGECGVLLEARSTK